MSSARRGGCGPWLLEPFALGLVEDLGLEALEHLLLGGVVGGVAGGLALDELDDDQVLPARADDLDRIGHLAGLEELHGGVELGRERLAATALHLGRALGRAILEVAAGVAGHVVGVGLGEGPEVLSGAGAADDFAGERLPLGLRLEAGAEGHGEDDPAGVVLAALALLLEDALVHGLDVLLGDADPALDAELEHLAFEELAPSSSR